jgi:hypothetical protein
MHNTCEEDRSSRTGEGRKGEEAKGEAKRAEGSEGNKTVTPARKRVTAENPGLCDSPAFTFGSTFAKEPSR